MPNPFVSVIIPVYNDAERLKLCLTALEAQTYPRDKYEVIVVDNGSNEDVAPIVADFNMAKITYELQLGSYAARNKGMSLAKGGIFAFTDSDCIPQADWIEKGVAGLLREPNCGLVGGEIEVFCRDPDRPTAAETFDRIRGFEQQLFLEEKHFGATANVFTFREVFDDVGLFASELKSGGDKEWGERVYAGGYRQIYVKEACVAHPARTSLRDLFKKISRITLNRSQGPRSIKMVLGTYYRNILPPVGPIARAWRDKRLIGVRQKLQYSCMLYAVQLTRVVEQTRQLFGGTQQRS